MTIGELERQTKERDAQRAEQEAEWMYELRAVDKYSQKDWDSSVPNEGPSQWSWDMDS